MKTKELKLIKDLYKGLQSYYDYSSNLEDAIFKCGDVVEDAVFEHMPRESDHFSHKDCRFLLDEVEKYMEDKG